MTETEYTAGLWYWSHFEAFRSNSVVSERHWNEERMRTSKEGRVGGSRSAEFGSKTQERGKWGEGVVLATIHRFLYLPVSSCQGAHQRLHAFCLSTRLWMKELARAQFQLFIACKPDRWREREFEEGVCVCMDVWVGFSIQWVCVCMCMHVHAHHMILIISVVCFLTHLVAFM